MSYNDMYYPQQPYTNMYQRGMGMPQYQKLEIIKVNGENGAKAFRMAPNSSCLLLDETQPIVWLCQSDGGGYHTVQPFTITPYQKEEEPNMMELFNSFDERLKRLEEINNDKSNFTTNAKQNNGNGKQPNANNSTTK